MSAAEDKVRAALLRVLARPDDTHYGTTCPRIGWYPDDDTGILTDVLQEYTDCCSAVCLVGEALMYQLDRITDDYAAGTISKHVAAARWAVWHKVAMNNLFDLVHGSEDLTFEDMYDDLETWTQMYWECVYSCDDGSAWVYFRSDHFIDIVQRLPIDTNLDDICAALLHVEPTAFVCTEDWEGVFVYASPRAEPCGDPLPGHNLNPKVVGYAPGSDGSPAFVLPEDILANCLEQHRAMQPGGDA